MASVTSSFILYVHLCLWHTWAGCNLCRKLIADDIREPHTYYQQIDLCVNVLILHQPCLIICYLRTVHLSVNSQFVIHEQVCWLDTHVNRFTILCKCSYTRGGKEILPGSFCFSQTKKCTRVYPHVHTFSIHKTPQLTERKGNLVKFSTFITIFCLQFSYAKSIYFELFSRSVHTEFRNHAAAPITEISIFWNRSISYAHKS